MMQITPEMGTMRPHWGTYFTVNDADEAARRAVRAWRQALRAGAGHPGRRPLLRHHLAAGRHVLRHLIQGLRESLEP